MIAVGFQYKDNSYKALIRLKEKGPKKEYHITVMDGTLERLLYGNHIVVEENGQLRRDSIIPGNEASGLKAVITDALLNFLN